MHRKLAYYSVVTSSHLPYAKALMNRLKRFDPDIERIVFVVDAESGCRQTEDSFEVIPVRAIVESELFQQVCFRYSAFELSNAVKAFASNYFLGNLKYDAWMYFDSDIMITRSCRDLFETFDDASVLVSPHLLSPVSEEHVIPLESNLLRLGIYNGGWMGFRRTAQTQLFLQWFTSRLTSYCFNEFKSTFVDQLWLNLAVNYFDGLGVLRHPGLNVAYWNIHERHLSRDSSGCILCNGMPLYFLHFSGWNPQMPDIMSIHLPNAQKKSVVWRELAHEYSRELLEMGYGESYSIVYAFDHFEDGFEIDLHQRRQFDHLLGVGQWPKGKNPFTSRKLLEPIPTAKKNRLGRTIRSTGTRLMQLFSMRD